METIRVSTKVVCVLDGGKRDYLYKSVFGGHLGVAGLFLFFLIVWGLAPLYLVAVNIISLDLKVTHSDCL